jgi:hypothetical protein
MRLSDVRFGRNFSDTRFSDVCSGSFFSSFSLSFNFSDIAASEAVMQHRQFIQL